MAESAWLSALTTLTPNLNPMVAAGKTLYELAESMKTLNEQLELQATFETQLEGIDGRMAAYDDSTQKIFTQAGTLTEVRNGITMACGSNLHGQITRDRAMQDQPKQKRQLVRHNGLRRRPIAVNILSIRLMVRSSVEWATVKSS